MMVVDLRAQKYTIINSMSTGQQTAKEYKALISKFLEDYQAAYPGSSNFTKNPSSWPVEMGK